MSWADGFHETDDPTPVSPLESGESSEEGTFGHPDELSAAFMGARDPNDEADEGDLDYFCDDDEEDDDDLDDDLDDDSEDDFDDDDDDVDDEL